MSTITYESIEKSIHNIDLEAMTAIAEGPNRTQRLVAMYAAVRPILSAVSVLPLLPPKFREALRLFLLTFDQFAQSAAQSDPDFKAGKDL